MKVGQVVLEKKYHDAVEHWRRHWLPDFDSLLSNWEKYFPKDEPFCLCAKLELGTSELVQIGDHQGEKKRLKPDELTEEEAKHLLAIIRAQASTEFGSIQQHAGTLHRAADDEDRFWVLRVMAEELRHGYQMFHLLLSQDWTHVSGGVKGVEMVEEILSMQTGSHVLDAFNLEYDSFIDNICFAAIIDRVGKYQLTMQKVCAYKPMADSMPPMLREEAFHLAAGVIPLRRWAQRAAKGDPLVTMHVIQKSVNKWLPRGLEMFGDERGGDTNVKFGFKDMKNREAQDSTSRRSAACCATSTRATCARASRTTAREGRAGAGRPRSHPRQARRRGVRGPDPHAGPALLPPQGRAACTMVGRGRASRSPTSTPTSSTSRSTCPRPTSPPATCGCTSRPCARSRPAR
jgi:1,2-phenylacetyl-CoA epoxidase catalytic subunit